MSADQILNVNQEAIDLLQKSWPEHFGCLFDMGLTAFERTFAKYPNLKRFFQFDDENLWRKDARMKKVVLGLQQTLAYAVTVFGESYPSEKERNEAIEGYANYLEEIGGFHRAVVADMQSSDFKLFNETLPTTIVDCIEQKRKSGPFNNDERELLLKVWQALTEFMLLHIEKGWNQSVEPKTPKLKKAYNNKQHKSETGQDDSSMPKREG